MATMYAVRAHVRGGPERLVYETVPRPEPAKGEMLIAVHAAAVTAGELAWDATWTDRLDATGNDRTPIIPAHEVSGTVAAIAEGAAAIGGLQLGDPVFGLLPFTRDGAAAEYVTAPAELLARKPESLDHVHAAALPLAGSTAWQALHDYAHVEPGQHILVHGGAGGVGSIVVQLAAMLGAKVSVTASRRDLAFVTDLGASTVIDYENERFEERVTDVDAVIDLVGGATLERSWAVLKPGGVLVGVAEPPAPDVALAHHARAAFFVVEPRRDELLRLARAVDDGRLRPVVDRVLPLHDTRSAYELLGTRHRRGKVVIAVTPERPTVNH